MEETIHKKKILNNNSRLRQEIVKSLKKIRIKYKKRPNHKLKKLDTQTRSFMHEVVARKSDKIIFSLFFSFDLFIFATMYINKKLHRKGKL